LKAVVKSLGMDPVEQWELRRSPIRVIATANDAHY
jgi:hypothetical protein